jgi:hypothetical protein
MTKLGCAVLSLTVLLAAAPEEVAASRPRARLPELTPAPPDSLGRALERGIIDEAEYALQRALSLFRPVAVSRRFGGAVAPAPRRATALLRDLAVRQRQLKGEDRLTAEALLARPTDNGAGDPVNIKYGAAEAERACGENVCVHYVTTGPHRVATDDSDSNGRPDYVDTVVEVLEDRVWKREITQLGFRRPKSDFRSTNNGGNGKTDFYLADLGAEVSPIYGYCASDDPHLRTEYRFADMSVYCVFDNDYSSTQFPSQTPLKNLRVTAAHEFFHAVQFAYDVFEDLWILENTAVWMEDEVYSRINDNLQFLTSSSMRHPDVPLDFGTSFFEYGNFVFWKYATQRLGTKLVRQAWRYADGARGGPDLYSLQALRRAVERNSSLGRIFADFAVANLVPENHYEKGSLYEQRVGGAPIDRRFILGSAKRATSLRRHRLDHLSSAYFSFVPGDGVKPAARLEVAVDGPTTKSKPKATLVAYNGPRIADRKFVSLNGESESIRIRFRNMTRVVLVLSNASTRYRSCFAFPSSPFSCAGSPVDQNKTFKYRAKLKQ